jgi:hypothetical protein
MTAKEARINLRASMALFRQRIRFPKIRIRQLLEIEDIVSIVKEFAGQRVQRMLEKK